MTTGTTGPRPTGSLPRLLLRLRAGSIAALCGLTAFPACDRRGTDPVGLAGDRALVEPAPDSGAPRQFYIDRRGDDGASGRSPKEAWQSIARLNAADLEPGDTVYFTARQVFPGSVELNSEDAGRPDAPVTLAVRGIGRATIRSGAKDGLRAYNMAGVRIEGLRFRGSGRRSNESMGIFFYTDLPGDRKLAHIRIREVDVAGYGRSGIIIGGWNGRTGFRDVRIQGVDTHRNGASGVEFYGEEMFAHSDVHIVGVRAYRNAGEPKATRNTGNGIVLGSVDGGVIEGSEAFRNGWAHGLDREGPVGIWAYDSRRIVIQNNRSCHNRTGGKTDGGGFDLDQNVSLSVMQYNWSCWNDGAGYLLAHGPDNGLHRGNVVRYNVSRNDGRKNGFAGLQVFGGVRDALFYGNVVDIGPAETGKPSGIRLHTARGIGSRTSRGVVFDGNIVHTQGGVPHVLIQGAQKSADTVIRNTIDRGPLRRWLQAQSATPKHTAPVRE